MRLPETRDLFVQRLEFPASAETVVETVGEEALDAPNGTTETIGEVLERCSESEFYSADDLYDSLVMHVSDAFIGRKFYDDRGSQPADPESEVSF
jgi:hypothetical protein